MQMLQLLGQMWQLRMKPKFKCTYAQRSIRNKGSEKDAHVIRFSIQHIKKSITSCKKTTIEKKLPSVHKTKFSYTPALR